MIAATLRPLAALALVGLLGSIDGCLQTGEPSVPLQPGVPAASAEGTGTVVGITDGDTLRLEVDGVELRVRLVGIDTPEVYPDVECFGPEAEDALAALAPRGSTLSYAYDRDPRDQYDRELMYLFTTDGTFINYELVAQGYAEALVVEPNDRYYDDFVIAEREAQSQGLGQWGQC
ncbi:thermonuclease family protein [Microcella sp.]|uniref:thermonuclease family protein n=1 Tax=Microcella sp. TaxID=1913979 RepID=UPI00299F6AAC|nr:thermonuclease family protein [Microcella sp.]MDX2026503.1 thermonuclease family protein [Microcella sp.]